MSLLKETVGAIVAQDPKSRAAARARLEQLTMPHWALGRLMDLAEDLAGMTRSLRPPVERRAVVVMAGDHGVAAEGVSKYPQEVTSQMVCNFVNGGSGINALARVSGARVVVVDMGVAGDLGPLAAEGKILSCRIGAGTGNMAVGPAMSREDAIRSVEAGIEVALMLAAETDLFATGDMGIANTTPSSAIVSVMTGAAVADVTGRGTGIDDAGLSLKVAVVEKALAVTRPDPDDAMDVLMKVGGFEIGGIAGLILGAASLRKPVLLDGFISTAGALIAQGLAPRAADYMIAAHKSVEAGHRISLQKLGKEPLLDLGLRLGEGTGAVLAMPIVEGAVRVLTEVATFEEAAVSGAVT
ncbi:MAG TPA: nicotinate-nucleotide--dimethylbenzimidazole phosphoribosyltransferase [Deltaproteobacteria bacterium]|nr:nicotinate-nucleotide--dimethylbenzimidazole phosphoribosyltransferase [Deltaproteobacteria bacterium]HBG73529.1 nicotinate-nucleotide--dimethylbenzimidazole phosphoribosyltransferase [Deltaproteobacteria bacterium]